MVEPIKNAAGRMSRVEARSGIRRSADVLKGMLLASALAGVVAAGAFVPSVAAAGSDRISITSSDATAMRAVQLGLNKSIVIDLPEDAHDILIASPEVADGVLRTARRIYIFGKEIGQTNIFIFGRSGEQIASLDLVIERDISQLVTTIERLVPNSEIQAEMINDNVVLTGNVPNPQAAAKAVQLAEVFVTGGEQSSGGGRFGAGAGGNAAGARQIDIIDVFKARESRVINLLKVAGEDQVHLKVTVAEVQRSVIKQLGVDSSFRRAVDGGLAYNASSTASTSLQAFAGGDGIVGQLTRGAFDMRASIRAMEQTGVMRTLAEPSMTAISGELAQFKVGGSFPLVTAAECTEEGRSATFEEKEYGIAMAFTPVVLTSGRISLKVRTEVSEPTTQGSQTGLCANRIGIRKRLADTTVELPSGGSMVIGGLVQDDVRQVVQGLPGLAKLPIFGTLFRSKEFTRNESELVIILTPYLVRPTATAKLTRPDQNYAPVADGPGFLLGRINRVYGTKRGKLPKGRYVGSIGFILE